MDKSTKIVYTHTSVKNREGEETVSDMYRGKLNQHQISSLSIYAKDSFSLLLPIHYF